MRNTCRCSLVSSRSLALQVIDDVLDVLRFVLVCNQKCVLRLHDDSILQSDGRDQQVLSLDEGIATIVHYNVAINSVA